MGWSEEDALQESRIKKRIADETASLRDALVRIGHLAQSCRLDMQGRLSDDEHCRAFDVLGNIQIQAADALEG